ncbi:unnamed protein product, partial [Porites evermanni]
EAPKEDDVTSAAEGRLQFDDDNLRAIAEVYKNEGNNEYNRKNFNSAIHFYSEGIKANCKDEELNAKLYSNRAAAHFDLGNYPETVNDAKVATELQPSFLKASVRGASACIQLKKFNEANEWCDKGLAVSFTRINILKYISLKILTFNFEKCIFVGPITAPKEDDVTPAAEKTFQFDEAPKEDDVTSAAEGRLQFDDDNLRAIAEVYKNEGNNEYNRKNFNSAIHFYSEGIKANCKDEELNAKLYSNRAAAHFDLGNYPETVNDAKVATELQPSFLKASVRGASACIQLKKFNEANEWCDKGLAVSFTR